MKKKMGKGGYTSILFDTPLTSNAYREYSVSENIREVWDSDWDMLFEDCSPEIVAECVNILSSLIASERVRPSVVNIDSSCPEVFCRIMSAVRSGYNGRMKKIEDTEKDLYDLYNCGVPEWSVVRGIISLAKQMRVAKISSAACDCCLYPEDILSLSVDELVDISNKIDECMKIDMQFDSDLNEIWTDNLELVNKTVSSRILGQQYLYTVTQNPGTNKPHLSFIGGNDWYFHVFENEEIAETFADRNGGDGLFGCTVKKIYPMEIFRFFHRYPSDKICLHTDHAKHIFLTENTLLDSIPQYSEDEEIL